MKKLLSMCVMTGLFATVGFAQNSTNATSTSTTTVPTEVKSKWSAGVMETATYNLKIDQADDVAGYQTAFTLGYKPQDITYSITATGNRNVAGADKKADKITNENRGMSFIDLSLSASKNLGTLSIFNEAKGGLGLTLPTSGKSITDKKLFGLSPKLELTHKFKDGFSFIALINPSVNFATNGNVASSASAEAAGVSYQLFPKFVTSLTMDHSSSKNGLKNKESIGPDIGFDFAPNDNADLSLYISQARNLINPSTEVRSKYALFAPEETSAAIVGTVLF